MNPIQVPILIAGGGSTGLSLAAELGWRGLPALIVEPSSEVNPHPRANAVANRTMEYLRRWGIADALIGAGVPADYPAAYFWISTLRGQEIHRLTLPGAAELERIRSQGNADPRHELHWSPYLKTIVGQNEVEALLRRYVAQQPSIQTRYGWQLEDFEERDDQVRSVISNRLTGERCEVSSRWLVGCDGGRSRVREKLSIALEGRGNLASFVSIYFDAPEFMQCHPFGPANIYFPLHRQHRGFLLNWNSGTTFTYHLVLDENTDWKSVDPRAAILSVIGCDTPIKIRSVQPWSAHALTARRYSSESGRIHLAGDAAHLFTPTGGLGMNTGVSDAIDLAWKLGANIQGWAGSNLLSSYDIERRPIGRRNTAEAADNFDRLYAVMQSGDELDADTPEGDALRQRLQDDLRNQEKLLKSSGVLLGYRYEGSPICVADGTPEPPDDPRTYSPVARPGHRAPHAWLGDGRSMLDVLGPWFTLICFDGSGATGRAIEEAARARGVPLRNISINDSRVRELYGDRPYVLVRPDMMVAWRGETLEDALSLVDRVRGQAQSTE
jgi:2-polyprenyl-6-methoxyphenol hydroxylase-like FAD-dependent oxidoreductase